MKLNNDNFDVMAIVAMILVTITGITGIITSNDVIDNKEKDNGLEINIDSLKSIEIKELKDSLRIMDSLYFQCRIENNMYRQMIIDNEKYN